MAGLGQRRRRARHRSRATTPEPHEECQRDDADNGQELNDTPTSLLAADILPFSFNRPYPLECRRVGRPSESLKGAHRTGRGTAPTRRREFIVSGVWVRNFTAGGSSGEVARAAREASGQIKLGRIDGWRRIAAMPGTIRRWPHHGHTRCSRGLLSRAEWCNETSEDAWSCSSSDVFMRALETRAPWKRRSATSLVRPVRKLAA